MADFSLPGRRQDTCTAEPSEPIIIINSDFLLFFCFTPKFEPLASQLNEPVLG